MNSWTSSGLSPLTAVRGLGAGPTPLDSSYSSSTSPETTVLLPLRKTKAFTLLELIVVIVILGILAAIAIPTFQKVIEKSQDNSAKQTLLAIDRNAKAIAAFENREPTEEDYAAAAGEVSATALDLGSHAAAYTTGTYAQPGVIGLEVSTSAAGLTIVSKSENCVLLNSASGAVTVFTRGPLGGNCSGATALAGPDAPSPSFALGCADGAYSAEYFLGTSLSGSPVATQCESAISYDWGTGGPSVVNRSDYYSIRWTSTTPTLAAGTYRFTSNTDDGIRLWVDGVLVIDQWGIFPPTTFTADVALDPGKHNVKIEYFEHEGGAVAQFSYAKVS